MQTYEIKKESAKSNIVILKSGTSRTKKSQYQVNHFLVLVYILKLKKST